MTGGAGADRFVFAGASRMDSVTDFTAAQGDLLDFRAEFGGYDAFLAGATITVSGGNTEIDLAAQSAHLTLVGVTATVDRSWFAGW